MTCLASAIGSTGSGRRAHLGPRRPRAYRSTGGRPPEPSSSRCSPPSLATSLEAAQRRDVMIAEAAQRRVEGRDAAQALIARARAAAEAERAAEETGFASSPRPRRGFAGNRRPSRPRRYGSGPRGGDRCSSPRRSPRPGPRSKGSETGPTTGAPRERGLGGRQRARPGHGPSPGGHRSAPAPLAASGSLSEAVDVLARLAVRAAGPRPATRSPPQPAACAATLLWNLRVLAGWLPAGGAETLRRAGRLVRDRQRRRAPARRSAAGRREPPYRLGTLATAWPRLAAAGPADELRAALAASPWGDPGGDAAARHPARRCGWPGPTGSPRGCRAARALGAGRRPRCCVARELLGRGGRCRRRAAAAASGLLGPALGGAAHSGRTSAPALPAAARWALADVDDAGDLWRAEAALVAAAARGRRPARSPGPGSARTAVVGAVALLAADAWLVAGRARDRGRARPRGALEVFDALA